MKILMFAPGSWIHSRRSLKWLLNAEQDVVFVDYERPTVNGSKHYKYVHYPTSQQFQPYLGDFISYHIYKRLVPIYLQWIRHISKADIIHLHWIDARADQIIRANLHPLVISALGSDINTYFIDNHSDKDLQRIGNILRTADLVLVDADDILEKSQQLAGQQINVKLLLSSINTKIFCMDYKHEIIKWRKKLGISPDATILLSIRALTPTYNQHLILEAFSRAIKFFSKPTYLLLKDYNTNPVYKKEIQGLILKLGIEPNTRLIEDQISDIDIPVLYKLTDLIINFPAYDAFPVSFIEAVAAARPVISCYLPAYKNTFAEKYFKMIEANNIESLCNGLIEFVNHTWKPRSSDLLEAQLWIKTNYDEAAAARNLISMYEDVISRY